jgi:primary-amine oxidase
MEPHPLDLLSPDEIRTAVTIVKKKFPPHIRFVIVELKEPIRREVLTFKFSPDRAVKRDIRMILLDKKKPQSYEVEVSLNKNEITKIKPLENVQPALMGSEYAQVEKMLKENKQFQESLKKRGIKNMDLVNIDVWSVGWYSEEDNPSRRLCRPFVFYKVHPDANGYACPVEGLSPLIDLNTLEVIKIDDFSTVPLPPYTGEYKDTWKQMQPVSPLKPLKVVQPQGPSFKVRSTIHIRPRQVT